MTEQKNLPMEQKEVNGFIDLVKGLAENPDIPVEKIKQIVDMQEHILDKNAEQSFNASMVKAQSEMPVVGKDKDNTQTKSKYSSYEAILKAAQPIYTRHGFSVMFYEGETKKENEIRICADIMHEAGHTKKSFIDIPLDATGIAGKVNKTGTHAKGSSVSYGRSYLIRMIFNIPTGDDDDGNAAGNNPITEDQEMELMVMLEKHNLNNDKNMQALYDHFKIEGLHELPQSEIGRAKTVIFTWIKKAKK